MFISSNPSGRQRPSSSASAPLRGGRGRPGDPISEPLHCFVLPCECVEDGVAVTGPASKPIDDGEKALCGCLHVEVGDVAPVPDDDGVVLGALGGKPMQ